MYIYPRSLLALVAAALDVAADFAQDVYLTTEKLAIVTHQASRR